MVRTCQNCQKTYETPPSLKPRYCSRACSNQGKLRGTEEPCAQCGAIFYKHASSPERRFCSKSCARTALNLTDANPSFHRDLAGENNPRFGKPGLAGEANPMFGRRKDKSPRWSGGRKIRKDGYVLILVPDDHPHPSDCKKSGTKFLLEHRWVMEQHLGRYLEPEEVVHHRDGNPLNNALDNLRLFASQQEHITVGHGKG